MATTVREIPAKLENCENFKGSNISAENYKAGSFHPGMFDFGRLSMADRERLKADAPWITYVVRSFGTPIAWRLYGGEIVTVDDTFSASTTRHQRLTREWADRFSLDSDRTDLRCPVCNEPARRLMPTRSVTPQIRQEGAEWSHVDGEPLCPVMGENGYVPAVPRP